MTIEKIIDKYHKLVYKICFDMLSSTQEAEDATQDSYIRLYKAYDRYECLDEKEIKNILCKIALNVCKDILKSSKYKINKVASEDEILKFENYTDGKDVDEYIILKDNLEEVKKVINNLKSPYKEILDYYYLREMDLDEIANKINVTKSTLKVQIYRGKEKLKEILIKDRGGGFF